MTKNRDSRQHPDPQPLNNSELGLEDLFLASAIQVLSIEQALARRDYGSIQQTAHSLKGAAMIFRMAATVNATQRVELVLSAGGDIDHEELCTACAALRQQIDSL